MKLFFLFVLVMTFTSNYAQSKQDIFEYLKIRIEEFSSNKKPELTLNGCNIKYRYGMTLPGNSPWTQEHSFSLSAIAEIFYVNEGGKSIIVLKFKSDDDIVTDIEQNGSRDFVETKKSLPFILYGSGVSVAEGKKMVALFKKLAKTCGAKFIEL